MSIIQIKILNSKLKSGDIFELKKITKKTISYLKQKLKDNEVIFREELFNNNHHEISKNLKSLIVLIENNKLDYKVYEALDNTSEYQEIDLHTLKNILDASDEDFS